MSMFVSMPIPDEDLHGVPADPLAVHRSQVLAAMIAEDDAVWGQIIATAAQWWHANGHPRPLLIDGRAYRRRTRTRHRRRT